MQFSCRTENDYDIFPPMQAKQLLTYLQQGVDALVERDAFKGGQIFRETQRMGFRAYAEHLHRDDLPLEDRLRWYFEIAQGVGKTAMQLAIVDAAQAAARQDGRRLRALLTVPTRQLLNQTFDEIAEYVPGLTERTGRIGDRFSEPGRDLTIIVSNSKLRLVEEGVIGADTIDLAIEDEGHNETSMRRVSNMRVAFAKTALISFTATADYDQGKGVHLTHGPHGFTRRLAETIRSGENAAYYRTQLHLIRVMPPSDEQVADAEENGVERLRHQMKKKAWRDFVVEHYRHGIDDQTGDPLWHNQAAFFGFDTSDAEILEDRFNSDPHWQLIAREMGFKAPAVSVHSNMSRALIRERLADIDAGRYLVVCADDMLKEGTNLPYLKVLYDANHESLVEKGQIIGRPGRRWRNPRKGYRLEGATIIDTLPYHGAHDPAENARARAKALRRSITAAEILGNTFVLGPATLTRPYPAYPRNTAIVLTDPGIEVESYVTLEDVHVIHAERRELIDGLWSTNPMTMQQVRASIEAYRQAHEGRNPTERDGSIDFGPLAGRANWSVLTAALRGGNGLHSDPEWRKWSKALARDGVPATLTQLLVDYGYSARPRNLTLAQIEASVLAHRAATGRLPSVQSDDLIGSGPLAGGLTWRYLDNVVRDGLYGLRKDPSWAAWAAKLASEQQNPSLYKYLLSQGIAVSAYRSASTTMASVKAAIENYASTHDKAPTAHSGTIDERFVSGLTWEQLNQGLPKGHFGLSKDDDWLALKKDMDASGKNLTLSALTILFNQRSSKAKVTLAEIKQSMVMYHRDVGKYPSQLSGEVLYGPFAGLRTWANLAQIVRTGWLGLSDDKAWQYLAAKYDGKFSLSKLRKEIVLEAKRELNSTAHPAALAP